MTVVAKSSRRRPLLVVAAVVVVLALALGLGLGLGLKHNHSQAAQPSATPTVAPLQSQPASNFVLNKLTGQPAQTRVFNFTISQVQGAPDGFSRPMLVVNGMYPGPSIEANQADRLLVNVHNNLPNATAIHWHGLFQNGTNFYDGTHGITECGIPPGQSLTYNFTFGEFSGTTWWQYCSYVNRVHPYPEITKHLTILSDYDAQYTDGITGSLVVHPTASSPPGLPSWDEELVVQMADWYHDKSETLLAQYFAPFGIQGTPGNEPVPDAGTLNGLGQYSASGSGGSYFNFTLERNKTYRIRLTNTGSFASFRFSVDSHPLTLIEADGTLLQPSTISGIMIAVAQRYSVLLHTNATSSPNSTYWIRTAVQNDMFTYVQPGQNLDIRGIIRYADAPSSGLPGDPASADPGPGVSGLKDVDGTTALVPLVPEIAPEVTHAVPVTVSFQNTPNNNFLGFMNTTSWVPLSGESTLMAVRKDPLGYAAANSSIAAGDQLISTHESIQVVDIQVDNLDDGDHPFHLHGHRPWVMGIGPGRYVGQALNNTNPLRRDTVLIPAYSYLVLRFVSDNPGLWAFHCHLSWHMAAGLLMQFNSLPSQAALLDLPQDMINQCSFKPS